MPESHPQSHLGSGWSFPINDVVLSHFARMIQSEEKCELMTNSDLDPNQAKVLKIIVFFSFSVCFLSPNGMHINLHSRSHRDFI